MKLSDKNSFNIHEVAEYFRVSKRTIYLWINKGMFETTGKGQKLRISTESISKALIPYTPADLTSPKFIRNALCDRIANAINRSIRGRCHKHDWESVLGYTTEQLREHLDKLFTNGMTWDKFMRGEIHIDHKIPIAVFHFSSIDDIDFKKCWALENLQPLWAKENIRKKDKLEKPFQPSLPLKI